MATTAKFVQTADPNIVVVEDGLDIMRLGKGIEKLSEKAVVWTEKMARQYLLLPDLEDDRPIDIKHVRKLAIDMRRGAFCDGVVTIVSAYLGKKEIKINGRHTAYGRLSAGPLKKEYIVRWLRYRVQTREDASLLYSMVDTGKPRTKSHLLRNLLASGHWSQYQPALRKLLAEGLAVWLWSSRTIRQTHNAADMVFMLKSEYEPLAQQIGKFAQPQYGTTTFAHMKRAPVAGAMFATFNKNRARAKEFWAGVRDGTGMRSPNDPRLRLSRTLLQGKIGAANGKGIGGEEMYRMCIEAWNAWRSDEELRVFRINLNLERPEPI